ncbi:chromodomain protein [Achlya hypogyna]|uniref:Chromodomain protein n=1 Tax=Achlya hypogyna TaxID=1202772 RepID=A0A1V9YWC0_ACHHY|nr:chromodomain protein [Achlya hypogyna]
MEQQQQGGGYQPPMDGGGGAPSHAYIPMHEGTPTSSNTSFSHAEPTSMEPSPIARPTYSWNEGSSTDAHHAPPTPGAPQDYPPMQVPNLNMSSLPTPLPQMQMPMGYPMPGMANGAMPNPMMAMPMRNPMADPMHMGQQGIYPQQPMHHQGGMHYPGMAHQPGYGQLPTLQHPHMAMNAPQPMRNQMPFPASYEFEVTLQKGQFGLCMNMGVKLGSISVLGFRQPQPGVMGPAEMCGAINVGDDLVAVDGIVLQTADDFKKVVPLLKSEAPATLRFRRHNRPEVSSGNGYFAEPVPNGTGTSGKVYAPGEAYLGVRYHAPNRWTAEVKSAQNHIQSLGEYPSEYLAAQAYNTYIFRNYGQGALKYMHPACRGQAQAPMAQIQAMQMMKAQPPVRKTILHAMFTVEQKEQLRSQIMVFKFSTSGNGIPNELLSIALKGAMPLDFNIQPKDRARKKTFMDEAPPRQKKAGRPRPKRSRKKHDDSDDDDDDDGADDDGNFEPKKIVPPTDVRRSRRNAGKETKRYSEVAENDGEEEDLEEEKRRKEEAAQKEEDDKHAMDKIVGMRFCDDPNNASVQTMEFLIKWKRASYMHTTWMTTNDMEVHGKGAVLRMRRYLQKHAREVELARLNPTDRREENTTYFPSAYLEVDRILDMMQNVTEPVVNAVTGETVLRHGHKYLIKWRDLSYADCTWEWADDVTDDRKIAIFHRSNHPPMVENAPRAFFEDVRPAPSEWAKYSESPKYNDANTLRSYQLEGLNWMVFCWYNRRNCILADEMGLGKTIQATVMLEHLRQHEHIRGPFLVVAPLATLGNWKREIESWTSMNCIVYHDSEGGAETRAFIRQHEFFYRQNDAYRRRGIYKFNVLITSYQTLMADAEFLQEIRWRYIVIDEAHKLKNRDAKLLASLRQFRWDSCLLMTGTPLQNGVFELWCLLNFIEPEKFPSQKLFYEQYGELNTAEQVASLHEQLRPYMLRRVKEDVEKSIPPKEETIIDVELTTMQKKYYRAIFERNRAYLNQGSNIAVANLMNVEMELRKCCNHPFLIRGVEQKELAHVTTEYERSRLMIQASGKLVLLEKMLAKFRAERKKVLVFSQFKIMLDILEDFFHTRQYTFERLDGALLGNARQAAIDRFNDTESDTFVFLLSTRAGGVGINLIAASIVVLFDSDWNPQNDLQAVARCHRIGQTQAVRIYRLVTKKTYEAQMFEIASKKLGMHHAVFETGGVRKDFDGSDDSNMMSLMSLDKEKVEMMIRYGAYAIMNNDEEDPENVKINELDIDHLLSSSRTIRYDPATGNTSEENGPAALSFSKASFTAETSDSTIDFNDGDFWEKVLGPKQVQVLASQVENGSLMTAGVDDIKNFLSALRELSRQLVKERQKGGQVADADQILSILIELKVRGPMSKLVNVRAIAADWLEVIERPKRRRNQEVESALMYHPFLDGDDDDDAPIEASKKGKKSKKAKVAAPRTSKKEKGGKSGIVISLHKQAPDEYKVVKVQSRVRTVNDRLSVDANDDDDDSDDGAADDPMDDSDEDVDDEDMDEEADDDLDEDEDEDDYDERKPKKRRLGGRKAVGAGLPAKRGRPRKLKSGKVEEVPLGEPTKPAEGMEEMWCRVCYSDQGYDDDPIVQCDKCRCAVHKFCYGIEKVPEGDTPWYCDLCTAHMDAAEVPKTCLMCPLTLPETAFKETVDGQWVHVVCAIWARGVEFEDIEHMRGLKNVAETMEVMDEEQKTATCVLCQQAQGCIKCSRNACTTYFHPLCGRQTRGAVDMYMNDTGSLRSFCEEHRPKNRSRNRGEVPSS